MSSDTAPPLEHAEPVTPAPLPAIGRITAYPHITRRLALALILLVAACCDFYQLQREGYANLYYAATVKSMLQSWHNFFFVSFDPGGFVTVDKPPLGFWIQAASAKLFGFSGFSILLPEALAGVLSVGLIYVLVRRIFGTAAGLLAALALAITPISVVTNRNNTIDSLLVFTVLLAAYAVSRAVERGSLRWLLFCAVLVGLGFNIKMLEAYLVVPALATVYLLGAPLGWWRRLWHLALAGVALLSVSLSWVLAVDLTPASARPYVGSSGSNSELALALGYNGLQRLLGNVFRIQSSLNSSAATATAPSGPGGVSENGAQGIFRLLNAQLGGQASWLLALGLLGILAAGWGLRPRALAHALPEQVRAWLRSSDARRAAHLTRQQSALVLWGVWTLTQAVFFSVAGFYHRYYLSMLAPGIAALAGVGIVLLWHDYRATGWRGWLLPLALVVTALSQAVILADYTGWNSWMTPLIVGISLVAACVLVVYRFATLPHATILGAQLPFLQRWGGASDRAAASASLPTAEASWHLRGRLQGWAFAPLLATVLGVGILFLGPATWTAVSLASGANGTLPSAGPAATFAQAGFDQAGGFRGSAFGRVRPSGANGFTAPPNGTFTRPSGTAPGGLPGAGTARRFTGRTQSQVDSKLLAYLEGHQGSTSYLFATLSSQTAAPYIITTAKPVMTLGGFSGSDQILTLSQLKALIREGQVRYFLLSGGGFGGPGGSGNSTLVNWIESHGTLVSASEYGSSSTGGAQLYSVSASAANS